MSIVPFPLPASETHAPRVLSALRARGDKPRKRLRINLAKSQPDPTLLAGLDPYALIKLDAIPWRRFGETVIYATVDPENFTPPETLPQVGTNFSAGFASRQSIRQAISKHFSETLLKDAHEYCAPELSCRDFEVKTGSNKFYVGVALLLCGLLVFPLIALTIAMLWITITSFATAVLRVSAIWAWRKDRAGSSKLPDNAVSIYRDKTLPKVTILVPLFHEERVLPSLIETLGRLDYPHASLDIKFLLEEVDEVTGAALEKIALPDFIECLTIPKDWLQTKPKAMNYAMPFCDGEIIGIYDAEDRPDADQILKVINHFHAAPKDVACVQGYLDFYNPRANWLARCFTIEYATWFRVILKGIQTLKLPIPLGGTTVFFRRDALEKVGGWDAHNVTEDADLGMRLARFGYRCEMVNTTTWEEANARPLPWVRQRSRWLKGYAITWATHMRDPARLWRELGAKGFVGFQVIFLGGLSAFLAGPMFWALWLSQFGAPILPLNALPSSIWWIFAGTLAFGQLVMGIAMLLAVWERGKCHLIPYFLSLPFYWPLGTLAAYKGIVELFIAPFYWDKTAHGVSKPDHPNEKSADNPSI